MKKLFVLFIALNILTWPGLCFGETELTTMDEVVVTATRNTESIRNVPSNVTVIDAEEIRESGATNITDLLESRANIHVKTNTGNASQAMIDLRGFGGDTPFGKTLVLLDGKRLNRPDMSSINWLQIPMELIERIEVVRGTNTVLYGDAAIGGVINIITKKGTIQPTYNFSLITGEDGSHVERLGCTGTKGNLSYAINGENQSTDGWRDRTSFESKGGGLRLSYDLTDDYSIAAGCLYNKTEFEMPGNLTRDEMMQDREQKQPARTWFPSAWFWFGFPATTPAHTDDEATNEYFNGDIAFEGSLEKMGDIEVNLVYGAKDLETDMPSGWVPGQYNQLDIKTLGATPKYILDRTFFGLGNKFIAGFDLYHESLTLNQYLDQGRNNKAWESELDKDSLGLYFSDELYLLEKLILYFGYRYEEAQFEGQKTQILGGGWGSAFTSEEKTHYEDAFDIGFTWLLGERSKFYGKYATLFRYPFTDEQVNYNGLNDGFNTSLDTETGKSYEIGGVYSPIAGLDISLTLFQINMEDEIVWDNTLNRNINLDETRHRGVEVSILYTKKDVYKFNCNYSYHEAEFQKGQYNGNEIPFVPNHHLVSILDLSLPYDLHLSPEMLYVSTSCLGNDFDNSSEKLGDYLLFNLFLKYNYKWKFNTINAFVGVKNIFEKNYETWGFENNPDDGAAPANTYYPANDREFTGGVSFVF